MKQNEPTTSVITLGHQTVPVSAISMMSLNRQAPRRFLLIVGGLVMLVALFTLLDTHYDPACPIGVTWILGGTAAAGAFYAWLGLQSIVWPRFYLSLQLHSGGTVVMTLPSERDARAAEYAVQSALLGLVAPEVGRIEPRFNF